MSWTQRLTERAITFAIAESDEDLAVAPHLAFLAHGGVDRGVLGAGLLPARGRRRVLAAERPASQERAWAKTDVADAAWIAQLIEHGLVRPSFVPPRPIRELRELTRDRKALIYERTRETQRLHKVLEDAGIKLGCVASDVLGVSGRAMLEALVGGTTDPEVLAELARGQLRKKLPALREALQGRVARHRRLLVAELLAHLDYLEEAIGRLSGEVAQVIAPFSPLLALLMTIPGVDRRTAEVILAEIGTDMARFPPPGIWRAGRGCAQATTSQPASTSRARPARAPDGYGPP